MAPIDDDKFEALCERYGVEAGLGDRAYLEGMHALRILTEKDFAHVLQLHRDASKADFDLAELRPREERPRPLDGRRLRQIELTHTSGGSAPECERTAALARHVARLAATSFEVRRFREWLLGGPTATVAPERSRDLLELPTLRFMAREELDRLGVPLLRHSAKLVQERPAQLSELRAAGKPLHEVMITCEVHITWPGQSRKWSGHRKVEDRRPLRLLDERGQVRTVPVYSGSVLDVVRMRAESVAKHYGWSEAGMTRFLLTGAPPSVSTLSGGATVTVHGSQERRLHLPVQATITIKAQSHLSPKAVEKMFARVQHRLTGHRKGPDVSSSNLALVNFVCEQIVEQGQRPPWHQLVALWNAQRRKPHYSSPSKMQRDYTRTAKSVFLLEISEDLGGAEHRLDSLARVLEGSKSASPSARRDSRSLR